MTVIRFATLPGLALAAVLAACASGSHDPTPPDQVSNAAYRPHNADYLPNHRASTSNGMVMTTPVGATVYTYDKDQLGKSNCYGDCARNWPPVIAAAAAQPYGRMSLVVRDDGQRQWAFDGKPLYTFGEDRTFGEAKGDNAGSVWHVVR